MRSVCYTLEELTRDEASHTRSATSYLAAMDFFVLLLISVR